MNSEERKKAWTVRVGLYKPDGTPVQANAGYFKTEKEARDALRAAREPLEQKR